MKKTIALILSMILVFSALSAVSASAAEINFVTAGTSGTFYAISVEVAKLWNDNIPGMHAVATPSGGGVDNLNQAKDGEAQIGIANANLVYQSMMGTDAFEGDANPDIRIFAGLYYNPNQVVVTNASGINSFADFAGKHFSVGAAGSTTIDEAAHHLATAGLTLDDMKTDDIDLPIMHLPGEKRYAFKKIFYKFSRGDFKRESDYISQVKNILLIDRPRLRKIRRICYRAFDRITGK